MRLSSAPRKNSGGWSSPGRPQIFHQHQTARSAARSRKRSAPSTAHSSPSPSQVRKKPKTTRTTCAQSPVPSTPGSPARNAPASRSCPKSTSASPTTSAPASSSAAPHPKCSALAYEKCASRTPSAGPFPAEPLGVRHQAQDHRAAGVAGGSQHRDKFIFAQVLGGLDLDHQWFITLAGLAEHVLDQLLVPERLW